MDTAQLDVKPGSFVRITSIQGDLRLTGCDVSRVEAQAGRRGGLHATAHGETIELTCSSGCLVFLPPDCPVEIVEVTGDARVTDLRTAVSLGSIGGDLRLRRLASVTVGKVRGDLLAQRISAGLTVEDAGGDVRLNQIAGEVHLGTVAGDLAGSALEGSLLARVRGDAAITLEPRAGSTSLLRVDGDAAVRVPTEASAVVELTAAGDLSVSSGGLTRSSDRSASLTLGAGEARLTVEAGGDLAFSGSERIPGADLASVITAQVEAALAEVEAELDVDLDSRVSGVGEEVRRAVERAFRPRPESRAPEQPGEPEREMILRMLSDGRITAAQAESLFRALEGEG
jgi:hypothetical protein